METGARPTRAAFDPSSVAAVLPFPNSTAATEADHRRIFSPEIPRGGGCYWSGGDCSSSGGEDDVDDEDHDEGDGFVSVDEINNNGNNENNDKQGNGNQRNNSSGSVQSSSDKFHHRETATSQDHHHRSAFGLVRGVAAVAAKDGGAEQYQQVQSANYDNAITVVQPEQYYVSMLQHEGDRSVLAEKEGELENGCEFGRKEGGLLVYAGDSVRTHLSDPITGVLMDDAMILSCGHSFSSGGMQQVYRMKACCKCAQPISEESIRPNLGLRAAVQAFRREEEMQSYKASKRKKERYEQDKCGYEEMCPGEYSRGKGVQFPFAVSDRVMIKGNKRTPERFVGRMAVVTTQCLNGWYVVKTLDNAESVKLQYRSLAKVSDDPSSSMTSNKSVTPSWL